MNIDIEKLQEIFGKRYMELASDAKDEEFFVNWCDKHKILMLHNDWLVETLNDGGMRGRVCIGSPEEGELNSCPWLLVPRKFAEKTLALGYLP